MVDEFDAEEVVDLALLEVGHFPEVADSVDHRLLYIVADDLDADHLPSAGGGGQIVDDSQGVFPVHADYGSEHVEAQACVILEMRGQVVPGFFGHDEEQILAALVILHLGADRAD